MMQGSAVESDDYKNGRVLLELRITGRLATATTRLVCATWALVAATIALVFAAVVQIVTMKGG